MYQADTLSFFILLSALLFSIIQQSFSIPHSYQYLVPNLFEFFARDKHQCACGTPSKTYVLCGFQNLFLQIFVRIFWQQPFFVHVNNLDIFSRCSAFKYVLLVYHRKCKLSSYFFTLYYKNRTFHSYLLLSIASYIYKRFFAITDMLP